MQPSDVSAYLNLQHTTDVGVPKRAEPASTGATANPHRWDTTSVSASARALTFQRQAEVVAQTLTPERAARLRDKPPELEHIAHAIIQSELEP